MKPSPAGISPLFLTLAVLSALLFVPLTVPLFTGRIFSLSDLSAFHLPLRYLYQRALVRGESFLWTSELAGGLYLHGEGQIGMAHPLHLGLYRLLPLGVAFNLELLSTYAIALSGMWLLLRRLGLRREPSLAGAIAFAFCGFNVFHFLHMNLVAVVAQIPWVLWACDLLLTGSTPRRRALGFAAAALTLGSQVLLGFPQSVWYTLLIVGWFGAYHVLNRVPVRRIIALATALLAGVLIGAVQLLPTLDLARDSFRADTPMEFRLSYSLHPWNLLQLVSPSTFATRIYTPEPAERYHVHEFAVYSGALSTLSVFWIAMRWRNLTRTRLAAALLGLAALGLVLALGRYGGAYPWLAQLPGLSGFRASTRHMVLMHFAFAGLTALVIEDLSELSRRRAVIAWRGLWPLAVPVAIGIAIVIGATAVANAAWTAHLKLRGAASAAGVAPMAAVALLLAFGARGVRGALPALVIVAALDLAWWGMPYMWRKPPTRIEWMVPRIGFPPEGRERDLLHPGYQLEDFNIYPMWGRRSTMAYVGLYDRRVLTPSDPVVQRVLGVTWAWTSQGWTEVTDPMPRVRLVADWRVTTNEAADLRAIDIAYTALVDAPPGETAGTPGRAALVGETPGRLTVATDAPAPQLLVVAERFHRGWHAAVDGRPVPVRRLYGDLLGCRVPAGAHEVTFTFAPSSARWGLRLTLAGVVFTFLGAFAIARSGPHPLRKARISSPRRM